MAKKMVFRSKHFGSLRGLGPKASVTFSCLSYKHGIPLFKLRSELGKAQDYSHCYHGFMGTVASKIRYAFTVSICFS